MIRRIDKKAVLEALRRVVGTGIRPVDLHEPCFHGNEWKYVKECIDAGWVSSVGSYVDRFERQLEDFTGVKHAIATVNGTAALHIALILTGVLPGEEVIVPALTFVATANAVVYCGGVPHFADSEERTLGLDPVHLEKYLENISELRGSSCINSKTGRRIRAVIAMHTFGHPVDLDEIIKICQRFHLDLIEDAAESLGSLYKGRHTGNWGKISILSFNGNKVATTGGGGAILTSDEHVAKLAKHLTTTARVSDKWEIQHDMVGYNYRLPNINSALGCAQIEQLAGFLSRKRVLAENYRKAFSEVEGVKLFTEPEFARSNYWLNVLLLEESCAHERDSILALLNDNGIGARPAWTLMHKLPMFRDYPRVDLSVAESLEKRMINLPSSVFLGEESPRA